MAQTTLDTEQHNSETKAPGVVSTSSAPAEAQSKAAQPEQAAVKKVQTSSASLGSADKCYLYSGFSKPRPCLCPADFGATLTHPTTANLSLGSDCQVSSQGCSLAADPKRTIQA